MDGGQRGASSLGPVTRHQSAAVSGPNRLHLCCRDTALIEAAAPAVRIVVALCALGYTGQMMSSYFECVEKIGEAIVCGIALYIIFTIPLVFVLGAAMGVSGVW